MKKMWAHRKNDETGVSPVIATILLVAVTVVLAAVLYLMSLGYAGTSGTITPMAAYQKQTISHGQRISILSITKTDIPWSDVKILLSDGTHFAEWTPVTDDLDGGSPISHNYSTQPFDTLMVCCCVYDISGNGYVSGSDYFEIFTYDGAETFFPAVNYNVVLIYELTGETIGTGVNFFG